MGMTKTQSIRPARSANGKVSALSMVKALVASGVPLANIALTAQLTDAERAELGI
jgi:hypothetical protein